MEPMENGHFLRNALLFVVGLAVAGMIAVWAIGALVHMLFYIIVGALVVGGGVYLYGRAKRAIRGERRRPPINRW
jgi:small neutral amino acid transporter SnatA (MarC family)